MMATCTSEKRSICKCKRQLIRFSKSSNETNCFHVQYMTHLHDYSLINIKYILNIFESLIKKLIFKFPQSIFAILLRFWRPLVKQSAKCVSLDN